MHLSERKIRSDYGGKMNVGLFEKTRTNHHLSKVETFFKLMILRKNSKKTLFTIILIISLSVLLLCGAIVLDFALGNDFTKCLSLLICLTGYNFLIRTIIGQTVTFFLVNGLAL